MLPFLAAFAFFAVFLYFAAICIGGFLGLIAGVRDAIRDF